MAQQMVGPFEAVVPTIGHLSLFRPAWDYLQRARGYPYDVLFEPFFGFLPFFHSCGYQVSVDQLSLSVL
jgi:hypothetical protein